MNAALDQLLSISQEALSIGFIVFLRVGAAMALLPAFGERSIPQRIRLLLALAFTFIVFPVVAEDIALTLSGGSGFVLLSETLIGLALGAVLRLMVLALQMAGTMAAQSTSLSQIFGGANSDPQPAMGHVLLVSGLALAVMSGLHVRLAEIFILSYEILPVGVLPDAEVTAHWGIDRVAQAFSLAFTLAAPFVVAALIYNVALGAINRAMPQLMVAFVGAPAITAGGLILLLLSTPFLLEVWMRALNGFLFNPFGGF